MPSRFDELIFFGCTWFVRAPEVVVFYAVIQLYISCQPLVAQVPPEAEPLPVPYRYDVQPHNTFLTNVFKPNV